MPTSSVAAASRLAAGMLQLAMAPHSALPMAMPPASTSMYSPRPRARTHHGKARCVAMFSVTVPVVQAAPATSNAGTIGHTDSARATTIIVAATANEAAVTR